MHSFSKPGTRAAILALPLLLLSPPPAPLLAQPAPPASAVAASAAEPIDPPTQVGRIARMSGQVSYRLPGEEQWRPASRNLPVIEGNAVYAAPGSRALIEIGQSRVALEGGTDLQFAAMNDTGLSSTLPRGAAYVMLSGLAPGEAAQIVTPQAGATMLGAGRYLFEMPESGPSRIAVLEGAAMLATPGGEMLMTSGQAAIFTEGVPPRIERAGPGAPIVAWADGALPQPRQALPAATLGMTGVSELAGYGQWGQTAEYGQVWYPSVGSGWAPYRDGTWQWVEPWGWTWVDAQPWGYAPSHYGRWVQVDSRWAWAPVLAVVIDALAPRPVWSPANVRFFGGGYDGWRSAPVGWVPLAPREPYYPWYRASPRYVERANARYVTNLREVTTVWAQGRDGRDFRPGERLDAFRNRRFATVVPADALRRSRPVRQEMGRVRAEDWRRAARLEEGPPRPGPDTAGLTPAAAQRLGMAPDAVRRGPVRAGPPVEAHAALQQRLPEELRGRPEARRGLEAAPRGEPPALAPRRPPDAVEDPRRTEDAPRRQAIEQQRRLMEEHQRRGAANAQGRGPGAPARAGTGEPPDRPGSPAAGMVDRQRRGAEAPQRDAAEPQRQGAAQPRYGVEQQRRAVEQQRRNDADQQRRAMEQQQRQAVDQQRRAVEQQQRQAVEQQRRAVEQQQRQAVEQQRRAVEQQQRQAVEQQRRAVEQQQRQAVEQQRRAMEQQQRQAVDQQRRAAEQQQRQAVEQQRRGAEQQQRRAAEQQQRQSDRRRNGQPD